MRKLCAAKFLAAFLAMLMTLELSGCAQLQRKFTRKKKAEKKPPHYRPVKAYEKKPLPELYEKHYVWWRSWQSELMSVMGRSRKKDARCISEIVSNLRDMQAMLEDAKAAELEPHIARLEGIRDMIVSGDTATKYKNDYVKGVLESEERKIRNNFRYKKVKDSLKEEF